MRTVEQYLRYNLTISQITELKRIWVINWVWWEWGYDFYKLCNKIWELKYFDEKKINALYNDLELLANEHDIDYTIWNTIYGFLRANYLFCLWVVGLTHWSTRTGRFLLFIWLFSWLIIFWIRFYNWNRKKDYILYLIK